MAENALQQLCACGTSPWSDYILRSFVEDGGLAKLVQKGITGVTSNPTIFEKAIAGTSDYDEQLQQLAQQHLSTEEIFQQLAARDVQMAADVLRPVYDRAGGKDGFVSIEVSPAAAHDTQRTMDDAHTLWKLVDRPNVMIKVPATPEGIPAIEELISEGINVNITLIFAVDVYEQVMDAYLKGLERRVQQGQPIDRIASVASFFVSRVDTLVDKLLAEREANAEPEQRQRMHELQGKAAIANAKIAYQRFQQIFGSDRFQTLAAKGAQVQRPLWASTSTKNPAYPDTMYVDELVGEHSVNTMPLQTIEAVLDHGKIQCGTVTQNVEKAHQEMAALRSVGIDMKQVTDQLTAEGVASFMKSLTDLYDTLEQKVSKISGGSGGALQASLDGQENQVNQALQTMQRENVVARIWQKDPNVWKTNPNEQNEITDRLGWLTVSDTMLQNLHVFKDVASYVQQQGFTHAVVMGMGGSSLAPYVLAQSFGPQQGFPELLVLDSTDPDAVADIEQAINIEKTLFLVSTKSGGTTETMSFYKTFWQKVQEKRGQEAGSQFVAITDPGTSLEQEARQQGFHDCYLNPADIGGRYSAMSYFGMIPAAVMGLDVERLLQSARGMEEACRPSVPVQDNPGAWLGAVMGTLAKAGRNKVTFFLSPGIETLGLWLEQLLAESTGKEGTGLVPVPDMPPGNPDVYANDRMFAFIALDGADNSSIQQKVQALEHAGFPAVQTNLADLYDLGAEFFRWEFATAVAGAELGINAFDQPNVQESKDNTKRVLQEFQSAGSLPEPQPVAQADGVTVYVNDAARSLVGGASSVDDVLHAFLSGLEAPDYLAIMACIAPTKENDQTLDALRVALRDTLHVATTMGYGPRFLHSTGQLHKGGPPEGYFLQITADAGKDIPIPGEPYGYQTLIKAQALGDFESLQQHGRPAVRLHLPNESLQELQQVQQLVMRALGSRQLTS